VERLPAVIVALLALLGVSVLVRFFGATSPAGALLLGAAGVGGIIGWLVGPRLPLWLPVTIAVISVVAMIVGFSQYNDDGPSGPLFEPLLVLGTRIIPALLAGMAAAVLAGHLRSGPDD
jgi:hypothetical protein